MSNNQYLINETSYLFEVNFFSNDFDPEGHEEHLLRAQKLLESCAWSDIFSAWSDYLFMRCQTPEEVINFANLFFYYGGHEQFITEPYDFLGYIYYRVDIEKYWDKAGEFLDELAVSILEKAGEISTINNPYYQSFKDPKMLEAIKKWQTMKEK